MSAIASYRSLLRTVGSTYIVVAIPLAMSQLGTLILVSTQSGRYALGGAAAGALAVANALGAPFAGGLADRIGQRPVVLGQSIVGAVGLVWVGLIGGHGVCLSRYALGAPGARCAVLELHVK